MMSENEEKARNEVTMRVIARSQEVQKKLYDIFDKPKPE